MKNVIDQVTRSFGIDFESRIFGDHDRAFLAPATGSRARLSRSAADVDALRMTVPDGLTPEGRRHAAILASFGGKAARA